MDISQETDNLKKADAALGIVCPMANEQENAVEFVEGVLAKCEGFKSVKFFVVLDNVSKDKTKELLDELQSRQSLLEVVWAPENRCVVDAYVRGYNEAVNSGCDWILEMDAGFSHLPDDIPNFFEKMEQGYDCVFGSRFCKGGSISQSPLKRRIISQGGTVVANLLLGTKLSDMTSGFEMFSRKTMQMLLERGINSRGHFFQTEIKTYCRKLRITEVPINYKMPSPGINNSVLIDAFKNLLHLVCLRLKGGL
jgi:dolichol-phosphate mannosyltransferase